MLQTQTAYWAVSGVVSWFVCLRVTRQSLSLEDSVKIITLMQQDMKQMDVANIVNWNQSDASRVTFPTEKKKYLSRKNTYVCLLVEILMLRLQLCTRGFDRQWVSSTKKDSCWQLSFTQSMQIISSQTRTDKRTYKMTLDNWPNCSSASPTLWQFYSCVEAKRKAFECTLCYWMTSTTWRVTIVLGRNHGWLPHATDPNTGYNN